MSNPLKTLVLCVLALLLAFYSPLSLAVDSTPDPATNTNLAGVQELPTWPAAHWGNATYSCRQLPAYQVLKQRVPLLEAFNVKLNNVGPLGWYAYFNHLGDLVSVNYETVQDAHNPTVCSVTYRRDAYTRNALSRTLAFAAKKHYADDPNPGTKPPFFSEQEVEELLAVSTVSAIWQPYDPSLDERELAGAYYHIVKFFQDTHGDFKAMVCYNYDDQNQLRAHEISITRTGKLQSRTSSDWWNLDWIHGSGMEQVDAEKNLQWDDALHTHQQK